MEPRPFERWCFDRRSAGERTLTPDERATLAALRRSLSRRLSLPWAAFVAYWGIVLVTLPDPAVADLARSLYMFLILLGLLLLLPVAILMSRDLWNDLQDAVRDMREDRVERFEPVASSTADLEGIVEVRHPSRRILTGPLDRIGDRAPIREVAPGPIVGMRVRHPAEGLPEGARLERRHLSPEEQDEIARVIARMERFPGIELLGALWCVLCLWAWTSSASPRPLTTYLIVAQGFIAGGWCVWTIVQNQMLARRMRADFHDGVALVFVPPDPYASAEEEGLPHSGLPWRIAGLPAEWRGGDFFRGRSR